MEIEDQKVPASAPGNVEFVELLRGEFKKRLRNNTQYSLRSFARDLKLNDSSLSQILRGRRAISRKTKQHLIEALGLSPDDVYKLDRAGDRAKLMQLNNDAFHILSDWYHDAILELMSFENFRSDNKWIAQKLGITTTIVSYALERMNRAGLIEKNKDGKWVNKLGDSTNILDSEFTNTAVKNYQEQLTDLSKASLRRDSKSVRDHTSLLFACSDAMVPAIKNEITQFRRKLARYAQLGVGQPRELLYVLQLALFPVSENLKLEIKENSDETN